LGDFFGKAISPEKVVLKNDFLSIIDDGRHSKAAMNNKSNKGYCLKN
jgi:hypothetical protein